MRRYHAQRYSPNNIVLAASGKLDFDELVRLAEQHGGHWQTQIAERDIRPNQKRGPDELVLRPEFNQESIYLMGSAPSAVSPLRYAADILSVVVGDDTGSRFYWALVDPGRVESVDMSYHEYEGAGAFIIGATCEPTMTADNLELIREILADVHASGITEDELQQAKSKVAARIVLAAERPRSRLFPVGYNWMYRNEFRSVDEDLADLASVTMEQVVELLETYPIVGMTTVCLGPLTTVAGLDRASSDSLRRAARLNRSR
jgi:predicted Zn-dependent peptidase